MSEIAPRLLNDTLNLVMLAREAALAAGRQNQAQRLAPVVEGLRTLAGGVSTVTAPAQPTTSVPAGTFGPLASSEFHSLLAAAQSVPLAGGTAPGGATSAVDRSLVAGAMSAGGMPEVDIARQLGVSREEVRLMLATNSGWR